MRSRFPGNRRAPSAGRAKKAAASEEPQYARDVLQILPSSSAVSAEAGSSETRSAKRLPSDIPMRFTDRISAKGFGLPYSQWLSIYDQRTGDTTRRRLSVRKRTKGKACPCCSAMRKGSKTRLRPQSPKMSRAHRRQSSGHARVQAHRLCAEISEFLRTVRDRL